MVAKQVVSSKAVATSAGGQISTPHAERVPGQSILSRELEILQRQRAAKASDIEIGSRCGYPVYVDDYGDYGDRYDDYNDF